MAEPFDTLFAELTGCTPFPWQRRLFHDWLFKGQIPSALDIPTGLGKTSIIPIWLTANLLKEPGSKLPTRLVYVVNRRTIVDQATNLAEKLRDRVHRLEAWRRLYASKHLAVSALRGALADNRQWMRDPSVPAIIIGTVDMIGSRLLFNAYRAGRWTRAMHAGLMAQDALIVHDEAHLSQPFQQLLEWIAHRQTHNGSLRPIRVLAMSATGSGDKSTVFGLEADDRSLSTVQCRVEALKRLKVHPFDPKSKVADKLASIAAAHEGQGPAARRVIVFVRTPDVAMSVQRRLIEHHQVDTHRVELLTGTIRGHERDLLIGKPTLQHLLNSTRPNQSVYLVSTSAGEVGADFDADDLVCDLTTLDAMIQRLGRVNRRGEGNATVDVVVDIKESDKLSDHQQRALLTARWLETLPQLRGDATGRLDASPNALRALRENDAIAYRSAIALAAQAVQPHPVTLDAWAMTSIQDDWPLAAAIEPYLHGLQDTEPAQTAVAWRDELPLFFSDSPTPSGLLQERAELYERWLDACPLRPREILTDRSNRVVELLITLAARVNEADPSHDAIFIRIERQKVYPQSLVQFAAQFAELGDDRNAQRRFCQQFRDQTFILPSDLGGMNSSGMIDPHSVHRVADVAEVVTERTETSEIRRRVWLKATEEGNFTPQSRGSIGIDTRDVTPTDPQKWTSWRDAIRSMLAMRPVPHFPIWQDDRLADVLLLFKPAPETQTIQERILLDDHLRDASDVAVNICGSLDLDPCIQQALALAAQSHDLGKRRHRWQRCIGNTDADHPLAKSFGRGIDVEWLDGYRHEFGSLLELTHPEQSISQKLNALDPVGRDLVLHLVAAHHGRGRPFFPVGAFDPDDPAHRVFDERISPGEIARRYARLQQRFGHWGLAWLESLVMCADHAASRNAEPEDTQ